MADAPAAVSTDRADRVADALAGARGRHAARHRPRQRPLADGLHRQQRAPRSSGATGSRRFVTDFRYLTQSAEQVDPAWEREIAVDLLAGVVKGLPGSGELRARPSTTPT